MIPALTITFDALMLVFLALTVRNQRRLAKANRALEADLGDAQMKALRWAKRTFDAQADLAQSRRTIVKLIVHHDAKTNRIASVPVLRDGELIELFPEAVSK